MNTLLAAYLPHLRAQLIKNIERSRRYNILLGLKLFYLHHIV